MFWVVAHIWHPLQVLQELDFTMDQFIDLCILCGCDYCDTIKGEFLLLFHCFLQMESIVRWMLKLWAFLVIVAIQFLKGSRSLFVLLVVVAIQSLKGGGTLFPDRVVTLVYIAVHPKVPWVLICVYVYVSTWGMRSSPFSFWNWEVLRISSIVEDFIHSCVKLICNINYICHEMKLQMIWVKSLKIC